MPCSFTVCTGQEVYLDNGRSNPSVGRVRNQREETLLLHIKEETRLCVMCSRA